MRQPAPGDSRPPATRRPAPPADPQPIVLPRDEAPHDRLTEWWYYTGHLLTDDGRRFGFEFVIFRAERGAFPVTWASHLALTDEDGRIPLRPALRDRATGRHSATGAPGFDLAHRADDMPGVPDRGIAVADERRGRPRLAHRGNVGLRHRPDADRHARRRPCSTMATAGSTSARRAARTTTRDHAWT